MSKDFFNEKANEWDEITEHSQEVISKVFKKIPDLDEPNILDVGCGTGVLIKFLLQKYGKSAKITAIDYAENMIEKARQKYDSYSNISYIADDVYEHAFPNSFYDLIICYSVFPHLKNKKEIIKKFHKLLNSGGYLVIFHSESREVINNLHKGIGGVVGHDHLPASEAVANMAIEAGFKVDTILDSDIYLLKFRKPKV